MFSVFVATQWSSSSECIKEQCCPKLPFFVQLYDLEAQDPVDRTRDEHPDTGESGDTYDVELSSVRTGCAEPFVCSLCREKFESYLQLLEHLDNGQCNVALAT
jgi:hypothetical protein